MKYLTFFICIFLFACNNNKSQQEKIRVTGEGKVRVKPNLVILTLQVSFTKPSMAEAVSRTQATVDSVVSILAAFKHSDNDLKTSSVSANKEYRYNGRNQVLAGYQAQQSIDFVLNDIKKFTELTAQLLGTKISSISQIQFGHSKADSLWREADLLAYDDALKSANKLCNRANVRLGKVIFMSNAPGNYQPEGHGYVTQEAVQTYSAAYARAGFKISPEVLEFKRNIVSEYEIMP